jgi:hypothetical protein
LSATLLHTLDDAEEGRPALPGLGLPTPHLLCSGKRFRVDATRYFFLESSPLGHLLRIELSNDPPNDSGDRFGSPGNLGNREAKRAKLSYLSLWRVVVAKLDPDQEQACEEMKECATRVVIWGMPKDPVKVPPPQIERYMGRISGPLLDRIDLHIEVPAVPHQELAARQDGTSSAIMRALVLKARENQACRFGGDGHRLNSRMTTRQMRKHCVLDATCQSLLQSAMENLGLSARAHDRVLRMARTIADLDGAEWIRESHLTEAINYRTLDRKLWSR